MAGGKTYHGLGEIEASFRDETLEGDPPREAYSGPTVVDALKVEQERLRSLDQTLDGVGGVAKPVAHPGPATRTPIAEAGRPTAVGHSTGTPAVGQTIAADPLRGTMFGHSIHLPEIDTPDDLPEEASSGALQVVEPSAPVQLTPFPLTDALTPAGSSVPRAEPLRPPRAEPLRRSDKAFSVPDEETDQLYAPRPKLFGRAALLIGGVGLVGLIVALLVRGADTEEPAPARRSPSASRPRPAEPPAPSVDTPPAAALPPPPARLPAAEVEVARPAQATAPLGGRSSPSRAASAPPAPEEKRAAGAEDQPRPAAAPPGSADEDEAVAPRPARSSGTRRRATRPASDEGEDEAKAVRPVRERPTLQEDPDGTLPPSSLD